jgi:hypothetical protein
MAEKWMNIITDLLDDHNMILYVLFALACIYPEQQELISGGILGFWVRDKTADK